MKALQIKLSSAKEVRDFVTTVQKYPFYIGLRCKGYEVDAKSILGIFSLDLTKPVNVEIHSPDCEDLIEELKFFNSDNNI